MAGCPTPSPSSPPSPDPTCTLGFQARGYPVGRGATSSAQEGEGGPRSPTSHLQGLESIPFDSEGLKTWGCQVAGPGLAIWLGPAWGPASWLAQNILTPQELHWAGHRCHTNTHRATQASPSSALHQYLGSWPLWAFLEWVGGPPEPTLSQTWPPGFI